MEPRLFADSLTARVLPPKTPQNPVRLVFIGLIAIVFLIGSVSKCIWLPGSVEPLTLEQQSGAFFVGLVYSQANRCSDFAWCSCFWRAVALEVDE